VEQRSGVAREIVDDLFALFLVASCIDKRVRPYEELVGDIHVGREHAVAEVLLRLHQCKLNAQEARIHGIQAKRVRGIDHHDLVVSRNQQEAEALQLVALTTNRQQHAERTVSL